MSFFTSSLIVLLLSYIIGSIPNGYLIGKFNGLDIRQYGSKNIGATNVRRVLGRSWSITCFILDFLKGLLPVLIIGKMLGSRWAVGGQWGEMIAALGAVLGHIFPFWLSFRGGKGVATSLGVVFGLSPLTFLIGVVIWVLSFYVFWQGIVSMASMLSLVMMAVVAALFRLSFRSPSWQTVVLLITLAVFVVVRHKDNIRRIMNGTENSFVKVPKR